MTRTGIGVAALVVAFVFLLVYLTAGSIPGTGSRSLPDDAELACRRAVSGRVTDARFPFPARVEPAKPEILRGVFDSGAPGSIVRQNYECQLSSAAATLEVDSVRIWQSH